VFLFTVLTDHQALECFQSQKHLSRRQARWTEFLQQYDFDVVYIKGHDNAAADALSRTQFADRGRGSGVGSLVMWLKNFFVARS
jgi:hypothetical protein